MSLGLMNDFIANIKDWVYNWDNIVFIITISIIGLLMAISIITFLKKVLGPKPKFHFFSFLFFAILTTLLVLILLIRI